MNKAVLNLSMMMAATLGATGMASSTYNDGSGNGLSDRDIANMPTKKHEAQKQGQKEWCINGKTVYAATKKAAIKKANKL